MDKDRTQICNILSRMLDNPDQHGIYPTSTAFTELELYNERVRFVKPLDGVTPIAVFYLRMGKTQELNLFQN